MGFGEIPDLAGSRLNSTAPAALITEAGDSMGKEAIIFFDKLGFGWVIDGTVLKDVKLGILQEEDLPNRSLIQIIENILAEKSVM